MCVRGFEKKDGDLEMDGDGLDWVGMDGWMSE